MIRFLMLIITLCFCILPSFSIIEDDFVETSLSKDLKIKEYKPPIICDDFVKNINYTPTKRKQVIVQEVLPKINNEVIKRPYNKFSNTDLPVKIRIKKEFSTKYNREEGQYIEFETIEETIFKNKTYPVGTTVKARVENISMNSSWGTPADLVISNFSIDRIPLCGEISKSGANRTLWVRPLAIIATPFCGTGFWLIFIRGGHAKINSNEVFTLYFYQ